MINKNANLNEGIREKEIRLVSDEGSEIISTRAALDMAIEKDMDLVMISPGANPPVCRIMDYNKFLYEQSKKQKEMKKNQKIVDLKEIRLSPTIEDHDIDVKANNAKRFLENEDKVKVTIRFRGRQNANTNVGYKVMQDFVDRIGEAGVVEKPAKLEGNNMIMIMAPKKQ
ncbi:translation initiation factor IF-3 [Clostridium sp. YIM B02515]|uniref:Translation initiation factor IF-3 n=1 Tax=Clostridium rhizosphaerae TaxID=2803861 RepID=A0ABS1T8I7_9CLOT|nr:translation initiation factor IF-3 [Clostridium rhizosphaerae]